MDARTVIIERVIEKVKNKIPDDALYDLQNIMFLELSQYTVQYHRDKTNPSNNAYILLDHFITDKRLEGLSENTLKQYERENRKLIDFLQKPLDRVTTQDLRYYLQYQQNLRGLSNVTLNNMRLYNSSFFNYLATENIISFNPSLGVSKIKCRQTVKKPFSPKEIEQIRQACKTKRDLALFDFLLSTGCRVTETQNLNIEDVNFRSGECLVLGKGNKERIVYLTEVAQLNLERYLNLRNDKCEALFVGIRDPKRLSKNGIEKALKKIGDEAHVEGVHPHRCRMTLATNLLDKGMEIQNVAKILGHEDLKTTQIYCYINQSNVKNSYQRFAN